MVPAAAAVATGIARKTRRPGTTASPQPGAISRCAETGVPGQGPDRAGAESIDADRRLCARRQRWAPCASRLLGQAVGESFSIRCHRVSPLLRSHVETTGLRHRRRHRRCQRTSVYHPRNAADHSAVQHTPTQQKTAVHRQDGSHGKEKTLAQGPPDSSIRPLVLPIRYTQTDPFRRP
jgi:hypothetical protein